MIEDEEVTWQYTLQVVTAGVFTVLFRSGRYDDLIEATKDFLYEMASVLINLLCLVLFPISIPVLFFVVRKLQRDNLVRMQAHRAKFRENLLPQLREKEWFDE